MTDIVQLYNPANAAGLTQDQILKMQSLTSGEIKQLADAYPNHLYNGAYLLIIDSTLKPTQRNLPNGTTWQNLYNLREKNGQRKWVAYGFKGAKQPKIVQVGRVSKNNRKVDIVDLSDAELLTLPGFKTSNLEIPATQVPVKKINKQTVSNTTPVSTTTQTKTPNNA